MDMDHHGLNMLAGAYVTARTGKWSAPSTWKGGTVPPNYAFVTVWPKHTLTCDARVVVCGLLISEGGTLTYDRTKSTGIFNCGNTVVLGNHIIKPPTGTAETYHIFPEIDESNYVGTSMDVLDTDIGMYVRGNGQLNIAGSTKTPWTRLAGTVLKDATTLPLIKAPSGWKIGDRLSIAPMGIPGTKDYYKQKEIVTIKSISSKTITINEPLEFDHVFLTSATGKKVTAEVVNLTRNVVIGGTDEGRSHINIMSNKPQFISYARLCFMGPQQTGMKVMGRYGLHFHMCGEGSRGSIIKGVVIEDSGAHGYVTHASHGVSYFDCVSHQVCGHAFMWDEPTTKDRTDVNNTNDVLYKGCLAAFTTPFPMGSVFRIHDFLFTSGKGNQCIDCVAFGNGGGQGSSNGGWPESSNYSEYNVWIVKNFLGHNNFFNLLFSWQNDPHKHTIDGFTGYNCGKYGIEQGAYTNAYLYMNGDIFNVFMAILLHANARPRSELDQFGYTLSFVNVITTSPLFITVHTLPNEGLPTLFKDCTFPTVIVNELPRIREDVVPSGLYHFVNCNLPFENFRLFGLEQGTLFEVQNKDYAYEIDDKGKMIPIPKFNLIK